uniref:DUF295 domain-containing protein n=1 Tax=Tanacetum cinerariifolium TaxID=118510 RepID=A0A6L2LXE8_TANCI|nr:hypothetical protein [Tanacetum cinerariifolium]
MLLELRSIFEKQARVESNGIYEIDMHDLVPNVNSIYNVRTKRAKHNLDSTYLWYCRLAHISKKRIEKLQHEGLLKSTDDESFDKCVSCLSIKMTRKSFPRRLERATDLLGIIHTDVCGPLRHVPRQESATRILNMVLTNKVDKTLYELCYGKVSNLSYLKAELFEINLITQEVNGRAIDLEEIQDEDTSPSDITSKNPMEVEGFEPPKEEVIPIRRGSYKWIDAINVEVQSMIDNMVWVLVDLPLGCKTVGSKWIFKKKTDMDGIVHTYKARLLAKVYTHLYGVDYKETFSRVTNIRAIRILIFIAAYYDYEIWQMDVKTAFLNGYSNEDIYMVQPKGFVDPNLPRKVCKLQSFIYGLKQASSSWNKRFDKEIKRVCKSWHSAAVLATKGNEPPSRLPSFMLSKTKGDEEFPKLSHLSKEAIPMTILAAKGNGPPSRLPSLMLLEKKGEEEFHDLFLLSNETIRKIRLPEIDTFPRFLETSGWDIGISKMVFLAPTSLVLVLWGCSWKLGFCRIGDKKWTHVDKGWHGTIEDITFYNGRVYSFDCNCHIRAWDVYGEDPTQIVNVSKFPEDDDYDEYINGAAYIIGLDDEERKRLLVVLRKGMCNDDTEQHNETYLTKNFQVFEYDLASEKWFKVEDLGSKALFVGFNSLFWIEEDPAGAIKGNCIYFTDDADEIYAFSKSGGGRDMGIYHLFDGAIESHFVEESCSHLTSPIWLQSI